MTIYKEPIDMTYTVRNEKKTSVLLVETIIGQFTNEIVAAMNNIYIDTKESL
ncbi:hypothetical protein GN160_03260 [Blochmannia endosymbiont of Colobopsis nipponica]|uniref:hypothetical protein n=1 Tax=Blochmannia endosymbiont of Colobopsis nipponica TaxID=2681987 RepID=UPI001786BC7C|nr:hypothetical protein [Blochmannia endosymbiont of Colobopsis nipponica]QOI11008.1 hypothetical protein GN160_03260 [Blochmannia endosymbiont of Colobopsis nipponica]